MTVTWLLPLFCYGEKGLASGKIHTTKWFSVNEYTDSPFWSQYKRKVLISGYLPYESLSCQLDRFCWSRFSRFLWILTDSVVNWNCPLVCPHADLSLSFFCFEAWAYRSLFSSVFCHLHLYSFRYDSCLQRLPWWLFLWVFSACAHKNMLNIRVTPFSFWVPLFLWSGSLFFWHL